MATVSTNAINPGLYKHMPYDAISDFTPVGRVGVTPTLLAGATLAARDRRQEPDRADQGQSRQIHLRLVRRRLDPASVRRGVQSRWPAGSRSTHVPYKGSAPMDTDLWAARSRWRSTRRRPRCRWRSRGKLRALGAGMATRIAAMPDLPTLQEQGLKGYECYTWNAILAPAGTPQPIVDKLNAAINKALADPEGDRPRWKRPASIRRRAARRRRPPSSSRPSWRNGRRSSRHRARRWIERSRDLIQTRENGFDRLFAAMIMSAVSPAKLGAPIGIWRLTI